MLLEIVAYFAGPFLAAGSIGLGGCGVFLRVAGTTRWQRHAGRALIVLAGAAFALAVVIGPLAASAGRQ